MSATAGDDSRAGDDHEHDLPDDSPVLRVECDGDIFDVGPGAFASFDDDDVDEAALAPAGDACGGGDGVPGLAAPPSCAASAPPATWVPLPFPDGVSATTIQQRLSAATHAALHAGGVAVFDSATGTGKTWAVLVQLVAWVRWRRQRGLKAQALFLARTHAQLRSSTAMLKRLGPATAVTLGGRKQYCQVPGVREAGDASSACKAALARKKKGGKGGIRCGLRAHGGAALAPAVRDVEDLVGAAVLCGRCPHFLAREEAAIAEVVFAPYNYLVDPALRDNLRVTLANAAVVVDEAHNIVDQAKRAVQTALSRGELAKILKTVRGLGCVVVVVCTSVLSIDDDVSFSCCFSR